MTTPNNNEEPTALANVVIIDYADLQQDDSSGKLLAAIEQAYGKDSIGLMAIRNVPGFLKAKAALLPMAHTLVRVALYNVCLCTFSCLL